MKKTYLIKLLLVGGCFCCGVSAQADTHSHVTWLITNESGGPLTLVAGSLYHTGIMTVAAPLTIQSRQQDIWIQAMTSHWNPAWAPTTTLNFAYDTPDGLPCYFHGYRGRALNDATCGIVNVCSTKYRFDVIKQFIVRNGTGQYYCNLTVSQRGVG